MLIQLEKDSMHELFREKRMIFKKWSVIQACSENPAPALLQHKHVTCSFFSRLLVLLNGKVGHYFYKINLRWLYLDFMIFTTPSVPFAVDEILV